MEESVRTIGVIVVLALTWLAGSVAANPVVTTFFSEIQTSPESLQRLEVHPYNWPEWPNPIDLSGCRVRTRTGTATINSGVVVNESAYVVIDRNNTTGTFSLGVDSDSIAVLTPAGDTEIWDLTYPSYSPGPYASWAPRPDMSCALAEFWVGFPDPYEVFAWYNDSTPTFGQPNDDVSGSISGTITDEHAQPLSGVLMTFSSQFGGAQFEEDTSSGSYRLWPTGPCTFWVSASKSGYGDGHYSDSVRVGTGEDRTGIDIVLHSLGNAEPVQVARPVLNWEGTILSATVTEPVTADLMTVNVLGQVCRRQRLELSPGTSRLQPALGLPSGIYMVRGLIGKESVNHKVMVLR